MASMMVHTNTYNERVEKQVEMIDHDVCKVCVS